MSLRGVTGSKTVPPLRHGKYFAGPYEQRCAASVKRTSGSKKIHDIHSPVIIDIGTFVIPTSLISAFRLASGSTTFSLETSIGGPSSSSFIVNGTCEVSRYRRGLLV